MNSQSNVTDVNQPHMDIVGGGARGRDFPGRSDVRFLQVMVDWWRHGVRCTEVDQRKRRAKTGNFFHPDSAERQEPSRSNLFLKGPS